MVTTTVPPVAATRPTVGLPGRRYDHYFFSATAALMLLTVFVGFAGTYYLAGVFHAPLPSLIVHLHGAAFTLWMILVIVQVSLIAGGRTDIHRRLGMAGFGLGCLMIVLGVWAGTDSLVRHSQVTDISGRDARGFYIVPLTDILLFATFLFFAFRTRRDSAAHKRYILLANTTLMVAAIARWPVVGTTRNIALYGLISNFFLLLLIAYDYWSTRKIHRATIWAGVLLVFVQQVRMPLGKTPLWHSFANWVIAHAR